LPARRSVIFEVNSDTEMYKAFFNLKRNPFDLIPDPTCFVSTPRHSEALAALHYGVREHKGFVVVTGEVGTGKTLLLRCLLRLFEGSKDISYAYLFNSRLTPNEFLQYMLLDFGLPASGKNKCELLFDLGKFLVSQDAKRMTTVLIVDEAHDLSEELLEEVRLLSNLETSGDKLLQILLVGQPELDEKLDSSGLRQLKQRITLRTQLDPLSSEETKAYIEQRLQIAGADSASSSVFSAEAVSAVYGFSHGFPRLINTICENALITAYARQMPSITPDIIKDVAEDFRLDVLPAPKVATSESEGGMDVPEKTDLRLDDSLAMKMPSATDPELDVTVGAEESGHEPDF
jgi:general secretion pathway protein A